MKNKWVKIGILMILIGLLLFVIGAFGSAWNKSDMLEDFFIEYDDITSITGKIGLGDIELVVGDSFSVTGKNVPRGLLKAVETNGGLSIDMVNKGRFFFGIEMFDFKRYSEKMGIVVTVPRGTVLDELDIELGIAQLSVDGLAAKNAYFDIGMGVCEATNVDFDNLELKCNIGDVSIELVKPREYYSVEAHGTMCDITVDGGIYHNSSAKGKVSIDCDISSVDVSFGK